MVDILGATTESEHTARQAGLRYSSDEQPGIHRIKRGAKGFLYRDERGKPVRNRADLDRIESLVIPPAWTDVWISPHEKGHLQATGRDARGRKQYRYHPDWTEAQEQSKYERVVSFAKVLPKIRRRVSRDLRKRGLPREKVLAAIVQLLEKSLIRVGNDEYARVNGSYGLTTMREKHVEIRGSSIRFRFRGKSGIQRDIALESAVLAKVARKCQELPGQDLFQYLAEDGKVVDVGSADVNEYLREISGMEISAKDFRTWAGTKLAAQALEEFEDFESNAAAKRNITRAIERVASRLGNTRTVCRKCYVHPAVIEAYLDRSLVEVLKRRTEQELKGLSHLPAEEAAVLGLLQGRLKQQLKAKRRRPRKHK